MNESEWSKDAPKEPGTYWFCGWVSNFCYYQAQERRTRLVKVTATGNSLMYVCDGAFVYPHEMRGVWTTAHVPEPEITTPTLVDGDILLLKAGTEYRCLTIPGKPQLDPETYRLHKNDRYQVTGRDEREGYVVKEFGGFRAIAVTREVALEAYYENVGAVLKEAFK